MSSIRILAARLARLAIIFALAAVVTRSATGPEPQGQEEGPLQASSVAMGDLTELSSPFVENRGQADQRVRYLAQTLGGNVFVTSEGVVYTFAIPTSSGNRRFALRERPDGTVPLSPSGLQPSDVQVNYFIGNQEDWLEAVPSYEGVSLGHPWPGVEVQLAARGSGVEKVFIVEPGAEPAAIVMRVEGADTITLEDDGTLSIATEAGALTMTKPVAYQKIDGRRVPVAVAYMVADDAYSFRVHAYDHDHALYIDPLLASTFLAGPSWAEAHAMALDSAENVFVAGIALGGDYPTTAGAYDTTFNGNHDVFVSKLSNDLTTLLASTFIGSNNVDTLYAVAIDSSDNVFIAGRSGGVFPTTAGAYWTTAGGGQNVFVSKFSNDLSTLIASTKLGGSGLDTADDLAFDASDNVLVTGNTQSTDYPTVAGAYDQTFNGGNDAFVSKLSNDLTLLLASTYLGGSLVDHGYSLSVDTSGAVFVSGDTESFDFPTSLGAYDETANGNQDVFVSKLSGDLGALTASTLLGSTNNEWLGVHTLSSTGSVLVTGNTTSSTFPTTPGTFDTSHNGGSDLFVADLTNDLVALAASTFLGGPSTDESSAIRTDSAGNVVVAGVAGTLYPTTASVIGPSNSGNFDVVVSVLDGSLSALVASTYLGGAAADWEWALAVDSSDQIYVAGASWSSNYPTTNGAYDETFNGTSDPFVSKLTSDLAEVYTSTYAGGKGLDAAQAIAVDASGDFVIVGRTDLDYPTTSGVYAVDRNGDTDAFISKIDGDLSVLLASTYLGGSDDDQALDVSVAGTGQIVVSGWTASVNYPTTLGAYDRLPNGNDDVFVSVLSNDLTRLDASTFIGGLGDEYGYAVAIDSQDQVFVTGRTDSANFPTTAGAFSETHSGGRDVFVTTFPIDLGSRNASTLAGGSGNEAAYAIAIDSADRPYVVGATNSTDYPATAAAHSNASSGGVDAFASRFDNALTALEASTYVGGSAPDSAFGVALDASNDLFLVGLTFSSDYPTNGAFDSTYNGVMDVVVSKLDAELETLIASTFLGGSLIDVGLAIAIDDDGNVFVTGTTMSLDYPTTPGVLDATANGDLDLFFSRLSNDLSVLSASTYYGGTSADMGLGILINANGDVVAAGLTLSSDFPNTGAGFDSGYSGSVDVFITKIAGSLE